MGVPVATNVARKKILLDTAALEETSAKNVENSYAKTYHKISQNKRDIIDERGITYIKEIYRGGNKVRSSRRFNDFVTIYKL